MPALVTDLLDMMRQHQSDRAAWEQTWLETARYALPDAERFDRLFMTSRAFAAIDSVVSEPTAARRSKEIYDQTSLWAVERGTNGTLSLITPQTGTWHDCGTTDPFAAEPTDEEDLFYETLRDYLFATRANPRSGFWQAHKAATRCMWAFGTGVMYVEESKRGASSPISYRYCPLSENHLGCDFEDNVNSNLRVFTRSAKQCVEKWGASMSPEVQKMAGSPIEKDKPVVILHAVYPRDERGSSRAVDGYGRSNRTSPWASCYVEVDRKRLIGEGGYWEFPFVVYHWQRNNPGPYAEGPMSLALADVKSLNMLAKQELRAVQMWVDPPYATVSGTQRLDLNPRAPNAGLLDEQGNMRIKPIVTQQRPDFAQTILEARRTQIRTTLYIDLWQSIINSTREQTAYEVMIKNQEKGDLLGPVGLSMQAGLSYMVDREIGILVRKGAFDSGSPLEAPESVRGHPIGVAKFTSPLDRLRRLPQLQGMTQLATTVTQVGQIKPEVLDKIDWDALIDEMQDILNAPQKIMTPESVLQEARTKRANMQNTQMGIEAARGGGEAATAAAGGVQALAESPAASDVLRRLAGVAGLPAG